MSALSKTFDAIIIGSGFGGSMVAHALVNAGKRVLMLERGKWVERGDHNWLPNATIDLSPHYTKESPYRVLAGGNSPTMGTYSCVGGPSVFYGGVSLRFRERDFEATSEIVGDSGAEWPYDYSQLEPYYSKAEQILDIAGDASVDPTEPPRSQDYPQQPGPLSYTSGMVRKAALKLKLHPFRLPLAINYQQGDGQAACISCPTCDTFSCAIEAKNDLATKILPGLIKQGLILKPRHVVTRLKSENRVITGVVAFDKTSDQVTEYRADTVVLSAGALASPHLLLASGLQNFNPGGHVIGRYLTRHCNAISFGFFPKRPDPNNEFHKQLAIHDYYFGHESIENPKGKLGSIQQLQTPPIGLVHGLLPKPLGKLVGLGVPHLTGLLVMAEDQPQHGNRIEIDPTQKDRFGLPQPLITHHYTSRDHAARAVLVKKASRILKQAGAWFCYTHKIKTFSHAVGTVRMGTDPQSSALDPSCKFRGIDNLYVVDGSFMPTSGGLNPSLTISANALRVGEHLLGSMN